MDVQLPLPTHDIRRGDGAFRPRCARSAIRHGVDRLHRSRGQAEFRVFQDVAASGGKVRGINAKGGRRQVFAAADRPAHRIRPTGFWRKGLAWFKVEADGTLASPIAKNFDATLLQKFAERMVAEPGDLLLLVADKWEVTCKALDGLRKRLGAELKLYDPADMHFSWVVEFPMFEFDEEEQRWAAMHHPFTAPRVQDLELLATDPAQPRAIAYDLVINGSEAGGGTIRIHDQKVQSSVFELLGMTSESARERFGFLLDASAIRRPPHGGIALGIDRFVMLFGGLDSIRDCIAFPKTQRAADLMTEAPGAVDKKQLTELALRIEK